jgi:hypothetical protein
LGKTPRGAGQLALAGLLAGAAAAWGAEAAQPPARNHYFVSPATSPIHVDGVLDEPAWASATVVPIDHEWFPLDNAEVPVATECLVTFDSENLYVAFRAHDPHPEGIRAHLADRDTPLLDDSVGFYIDTFNDHRRAFEFRVNPLGVQMDAILSDVGNTEDWSWDATWDSAGRITEDGYTVEIALPLRQLRFAAGSEVQTWGFLASREYPRSVDHQLKSTALDRGHDCTVCQFDTLTGFRRIVAGHNLELVPTATGKRNDARASLAGRRVDGPVKGDAGLTGRWGVTPNITVNAALNPDFSQVEADAAQLNVNAAFALFFPEKRPFFLEGADYFGTLLQAVFTRTIADPEAALKVTGKESGAAFGGFAARDRLNNLIFPANQGSTFQSFNQTVNSGVLRYRHDVGQTSTIGVLATDREGAGYFNRVEGLDGTVHLTNPDTVRFQYLHASTRYPDAIAAAQAQAFGTFDGDAYQVNYSHTTREWQWTGYYTNFDPGFRADSGFINRVDYHGGEVSLLRTIWGEPDGWFSRLRFYVARREFKDHTNFTTDSGADGVLVYEGPQQTVVQLGLRPNPIETFRGVHYSDFREDLTLAWRPSGDLGLGMFVRHGDIIDVVNARQSQLLELKPSFDFRLGRRGEGTFSDDLQTFRFKGREFLRANLAQTRLLYHLNLRTFVRAIVQYRDVRRDLTLYNHPAAQLPRDRNLFTQLLFSYKLNPETVLQIGYSDTYESTDLFDITQLNRAFFVKIGYAWFR